MGKAEASLPTWLDLYDYRRRMADLYREREASFRAGADEQMVLNRFRAMKDALFAHHPQSALGAEERATFTGLRYFAYDPALCVEARLEPLADETPATLDASGPHAMQFRRAALAHFAIGETPITLTVYWIDVYGGGLFLPFRDATCPAESYGGGRYLFDTVKGSDFLALDEPAANGMGFGGGRILLDFNYAYNPSCAYDERWVCPLAPRENVVPLPVRAGEQKYHE